MSSLLLHDAVLLDPEAAAPEPGQLLLEDGRIAARLPADAAGPPAARRVDLAGRWLAPGFLDLHFHGGMIFAAAGDAAAALARDSASLVRHGTTGFLATSVAWPREILGERVSELTAALAAGGWPGAVPLGLHLEGPWINPGAAGAQPGDGIRGFSAAEGEELLARCEGCLRMVTLAPEVEGAEGLLAALARAGCVAALGHSLASAEEVAAAVERGATHVTHLFNAMGPLHHRAPGLTGHALSDDRLTCDLICDGAHVHPDMVRLAARAKGERLVLISDRIDPPAGAAGFGSGAVRDDGVALRLADGRLAGSRVTLDRALRNARRFAGLSLLDAVAACSLRPARVLGLEAQCGTLRPGARADLVVLDAEQGVVETWIGGRRVH